MGVGSYVELYTTVYGWQIYAIIWDALVQTGIIFVPFLVMVFTAMINIVKVMGGFSVGDEFQVQRTLTALVVQLMIAVTVLVLAVMPVADVSGTNLSYSSRPTFVMSAPPDVTQANDPTVLSHSLGTTISTSAQMPLAWSLITRLSSGITFGIAYALPRKPDFEQAVVALSSDRITDNKVASQLTPFRQSCYVPARAKLQSWLQTGRTSGALQNLLDTHGADGVAWMGSPIYTQTPGLYRQCDDPNTCGDSLRASEPMGDWAYDPVRDGGADSDLVTDQTRGQPYCDEWWKEMKRNLLRDPGRRSAMDKIWSGLQTAWSWLTDADVEELKLKKLIANSEQAKYRAMREQVGSQFDEDSSINVGNISALGAVIGKLRSLVSIKGAEYAFTGFKSYTNARKMAYYKRALPTIIALMLMVFPIVVPFVMIWKSYDLGTLITAGVAYFAVRFMSALFEIGMYVERQLMEAVMDGPGTVAAYLISGQLESAEGLLAFSFVLYAIFFIVPALFIYFAVAMGMSFNTFMNAQGAGIGHVDPDSGVGMVTRGVGGRIANFGRGGGRG